VPVATEPSIANDRAIELYEKAGLYARPLWGQANALRGTNHAALAEHPPTKSEIAAGDFSGGLAVINGTPHHAGGFVTSVDIDRAIPEWPEQRHPDWLLVEQGTGPGKWHLFQRTKDQLIGSAEIYVRSEYDAWKANPKSPRNPNGLSKPSALAEFKGKGVTALRSYPSLPPNKPSGYTPVHLASSVLGEPQYTVGQLISLFVDIFHWKHGLDAIVIRTVIDAPRTGQLAPEGLASDVERSLLEAGAKLGPVTASGWQQGFCPFHDDRQRSLSVNLDKGAWKCFAGCGGGSIVSLAKMLGLAVKPSGRGPSVSSEAMAQGPDADEAFDQLWLEAETHDSSGIQTTDESWVSEDESPLVADHRSGKCWRCGESWDNAHDQSCPECHGAICPSCKACHRTCHRYLMEQGITEEDLRWSERIFDGQAGVIRRKADVHLVGERYEVDWSPYITPKNGYDDDVVAFTKQLHLLHYKWWCKFLGEGASFYSAQLEHHDEEVAASMVGSMLERSKDAAGRYSMMAFQHPDTRIWHLIGTVALLEGRKRKDGSRSPAMLLEENPLGFIVNAISGLDSPTKHGLHHRKAYRSTRGLSLEEFQRPVSKSVDADSEREDGKVATLHEQDGVSVEGKGLSGNTLIGWFDPVIPSYQQRVFDEVSREGFRVLINGNQETVWEVKDGRVSKAHAKWSIDPTEVPDGERVLLRTLDRLGMRYPKKHR
jgi:hypothetical protein